MTTDDLDYLVGEEWDAHVARVLEMRKRVDDVREPYKSKYDAAEAMLAFRERLESSLQSCPHSEETGARARARIAAARCLR